MATPLTPNQLIAAFKKWGVPYKEYSGWKTRTRPGGFTPIGFIIHHTGGAFTESDSYLKFLFETGRPTEGIPGPLCNFSGGPTGTIHIGAIGRSNHAGAGDWTTRQLVGAESYSGYSSEIKPGADDYGGGNGLYYGLEINYPGTVPMKDAQWKSAVRVGAALMDAHGWTALSCIGHREHSRRKWDPGQALLHTYRKDVRALLNAGPEGDDDLKADEREALLRIDRTLTNKGSYLVASPATGKGYSARYGVQRAWYWAWLASGKKIPFSAWMKERWPDTPDEGYSPRAYIRSDYGHSRAANENSAKLLEGQASMAAELAAMRNALEQLLDDPAAPINMDQVTAAAQAGAQQAMAKLQITVQVNPTEEPTEGDENVE